MKKDHTNGRRSMLPIVRTDSIHNGILTITLPEYSQEAGEKEEYA